MELLSAGGEPFVLSKAQRLSILKQSRALFSVRASHLSADLCFYFRPVFRAIVQIEHFQAEKKGVSFPVTKWHRLLFIRA